MKAAQMPPIQTTMLRSESNTEVTALLYKGVFDMRNIALSVSCHGSCIATIALLMITSVHADSTINPNASPEAQTLYGKVRSNTNTNHYFPGVHEEVQNQGG